MPKRLRLKTFAETFRMLCGVSSVCTLALTVAKTSSHYDRFAISVPAWSLLLFELVLQDGNISGPRGPQGTRGNGDISEARFMLCIVPTVMVSFFFNSRILQTGPKQFVENQKQNQDKTRHGKFAETSRVFLPNRLCRNVLFPISWIFVINQVPCVSS